MVSGRTGRAFTAGSTVTNGADTRSHLGFVVPANAGTTHTLRPHGFASAPTNDGGHGSLRSQVRRRVCVRSQIRFSNSQVDRHCNDVTDKSAHGPSSCPGRGAASFTLRRRAGTCSYQGGSRFCSASFRFAHAALRPGHDSRATAFSPRIAPEVCQKFLTLRIEGTGNTGRSMHPQPRMQNKSEHTSIVTTVTPVSPGIPRAMVLTAYNGLSPVTGLFCHRRLRFLSQT
jgi:hypothetical protein